MAAASNTTSLMRYLKAYVIIDVCFSEMSGRVNWRRLAWQAVEVFFAETVGTAMLLFFGCMGTIAWTPEPLNPLQSPVVFSVVVATIIQVTTLTLSCADTQPCH